MTSPRAVILDIGGVLCRSDLNSSTRWEPLAAALAGHDGHPTLAHIRNVLPSAYGVDGAGADALMRELWDSYLGEPIPRMIDYLRELRPAYRTALLSNSMDGAREQEQIRYGFGDMTDLIVYSHEEGISKPDPRIYEVTCARLGVSPSDCVFVDDHPPNVTAARDFGMHGLLFETAAQTISDLDSLLAC